MVLKRAAASAPTKLILFGEHFVVYGAPGIAIPISPRNHVEVNAQEGDACLNLTGVMGDATFCADGGVTGDLSLEMFEAAYRFLNEKGIANRGFFKALVTLDMRCKGIGNSSSIGAALGLAVAMAAGKKLSKDEIFECAQKVDETAHGGRPSGIDARTVVEGRPQVFRRLFTPPRFEFTTARIRLPPDVCFLVIDTFVDKKSTTGELVGKFGESVGVKGLPESLNEQERASVCEPYIKLYKRAKETIGIGAPGALRDIGRLMNENHLLLSERGVSTSEIEAVRCACLKAGAWGVKISGAGGRGGAVMALIDKKREPDISSSVRDLGFKCFPVGLAKEGVVLE